MLWKIAKAGTDPVLSYAADELLRCFTAMGEGNETAILSFAAYDASMTDVLWLGVCPELVNQVEDSVQDDLFAIDVEGTSGAIRGSNARSVLMGVYRFLKEMGCSWVRPGADGEFIPQKTLADVNVHITEKPSYRHRGICIEGAVSYENVADMIDWMPKVGMNAWFNQFNNPVTFYSRWYEHQGNPLLEGTKLTGKQIEGLRDQSIVELKRRGLLYHAAGHGWTCEPFGIPGEDWEAREYDVPAASVKYLAKVNGKRAIWKGVSLNTNLCYSNPTVRKKMATAVAQRCAEVPEIDYIQVWLADGTNNHCECENCKKMRPSDWYVSVLNEIDAELTKKKLPTKVVFLMYVDLLWEPEYVELKNPDRFVLMFAPITRTYSASIADAEYFDEKNLPPYERNQLQFPDSVGENLAWMRRWRRRFAGDGFDFDYHFMWDHFLDPGYYNMAELLFRDMQGLHKVGLNGMMSCQNQRVFFPTGLGMVAMAEALWDETADFETVAKKYFRDAFGEDGETVRLYLKQLSDHFDPVYIRGEKDAVSPENAQLLAQIPGILDASRPLIEARAADETLPQSVRASWKNLSFHSDYCRLYALVYQRKAEGKFDEARAVLRDLTSFARRNELPLQHVFDVFEFQSTLRGRLEIGMDA